ncbi:MAG: tRNA uridine-5-carboxymethylaminomethyl(34) synthesis GTPase MnmE [Christensenellales bacterium]|jgi:tRNA modification GTPase
MNILFDRISDTIAAIATSLGRGGIAIVRVSGDLAGEIAGKVFRPFKSPKRLKHRIMTYGHAIAPDESPIDEGLAVFFRGPNSYTTQDVLEIHCHGGSEMARQVLSSCMAAGARLAEPGEFTKRAFLNGRIDLSQAEAVMRIISAKSEKAARLSQKQLDGALSKEITSLQSDLLDIMAGIEAAADYPEEDVDDMTLRQTFDRILSIYAALDRLLKSADYAKKLRDGIRICIAGKPNAGKSSLMNALLGENRAIVTDIAGTTRDILTEPLNINGIPATICDTAGLRAGAETEGDVIERIGIERARAEIQSADIVLLVWDMGEEFTDEDRRIIDLDKPMILVKNKTDLFGEGEAFIPSDVEIPSVTVSALTLQGIDELKQMLSSMFEESDSLGDASLTEERHVASVKSARKALGLALAAIEAGMPVDVCAIDLRDAWHHLGLITGKTADDELISRIFESFCLGK